jgi:hypothetical protein
MAMRGGHIGLDMPVEMIRQVLEGNWNEYDRDGWHVVSCPVFTVMEKACQVGPQVFPLRPWRQTYADIVYDGGHDVKLVKPGQQTIDIEGQASFVRLVQYGQGDR